MKQETVKNDSRASGSERGFRWWAGRLVLVGGILILILGAATWLAGRSARNNLSRSAEPLNNSQQTIEDQSGRQIPYQQSEPVVEPVPQLAGASSAEALASPSPMAASSLSVAAPSATPGAEPTPAPSPEPTQARPTQVEFTLLTGFESGRMLFVGVGGDIEGVVSPDLVVSPGTVVRVILVNGDGIAHDVFFPDFDAQSEVIGRKDETTAVTFTVPEEYAEGTYVYYCTRPGHREAGQEGWLIVDRG